MMTEIVRALVSSGATPEMILAAVEAYEIDQLNKIKEKREKDAERQRRYRMSRDVTVTIRESQFVTVTPPTPPLDAPLSLSPDPLPLPPLNPPVTPVLVRASRGTRLSVDWELDEEWGKWAMQQGMAFDAVVIEADKFKDWWIAKAGAGGTKTNWEATWRNWIRRQLEEGGKWENSKKYKLNNHSR